MSAITMTPIVYWAQNKDSLFLTVSVEDCKNPTIELKENTLFFKGSGGTEKKDYEVLMTFNKNIDPEKSNEHRSDREITFKLHKTKESAGFWPRLLKDSKKPHFLKTDFSKWKEEDDTDDEGTDDFNLDAMMSQMGGLQGGDAPFDPKDDDEDDSDDEDLPELQQ